MRNPGLEEAQAGIKIARRNIDNLRYTDDTTLMAESKEELKSLLMKESEKVGLTGQDWVTELNWAYISYLLPLIQSVNSVTQSYPTLCDPMDYSMPGFPVHHQLLEFTRTHVHWVGGATQSSHPLSSPSPKFNLSQNQGLLKWVSSSHQVATVLEFQLQYQLFQWIFRTDFL